MKENYNLTKLLLCDNNWSESKEYKTRIEGYRYYSILGFELNTYGNHADNFINTGYKDNHEAYDLGKEAVIINKYIVDNDLEDKYINQIIKGFEFYQDFREFILNKY